MRWVVTGDTSIDLPQATRVMAYRVAKEALATGDSVYDLVIAKGWLTREQLDEMLDPVRMTSPLQPSTPA